MSFSGVSRVLWAHLEFFCFWSVVKHKKHCSWKFTIAEYWMAWASRLRCSEIRDRKCSANSTLETLIRVWMSWERKFSWAVVNEFFNAVFLCAKMVSRFGHCLDSWLLVARRYSKPTVVSFLTSSISFEIQLTLSIVLKCYQFGSLLTLKLVCLFLVERLQVLLFIRFVIDF